MAVLMADYWAERMADSWDGPKAVKTAASKVYCWVVRTVALKVECSDGMLAACLAVLRVVEWVSMWVVRSVVQKAGQMAALMVYD
jgi:hypothetical protein